MDSSLHLLALALNSSPSHATAVTPNSLFLGRDTLHPLGNIWGLPLLSDQLDNNFNHQELWEETTKQLQKYYQQMSRSHVQRHSAPDYKIGDLVLIRTHFLSKKVDKFTSKLCDKWEGPFKILALTTPVSLLLENVETKKISKCHVFNTKPFVVPASP